MEPARLGIADRQVRRAAFRRIRARAIKGYEWLAERILEPTRLAKVQSLVPIAQELGCTLAQMSIAWCLKNPHVSTVITGASRPAQVVENLQALVGRAEAHAGRHGAHRGRNRKLKAPHA